MLLAAMFFFAPLTVYIIVLIRSTLVVYSNYALIHLSQNMFGLELSLSFCKSNY